MIDVGDPDLYAESLRRLGEHRASLGGAFRGRLVQLFLGLKFLEPQLPSLQSGRFLPGNVLKTLLDTPFVKASLPPVRCVLMLFQGRYSARSGLRRQNAWRTNLHYEHGIGCLAPAADLADPTFVHQPRIRCPHLRPGPGDGMKGATCRLHGGEGAPPKYRGESHRKWLHLDPAGRGYAVIGLRDIKNFAPYVAPAGRRLPALSTIVALYYDAATGDRARTGVDIATFMADFHLSAKEFHAYFDSDPDSPGNIDMTSRDPGRPGRTGPPGNPFNAGRRVEGRKQP